jgi:hypothetical protein
MRTAGVLCCMLSRKRPLYHAALSIALTGAEPDHQGVLHVTPNCMSLDELEGCINALQDELDVIRGEARRIFIASVGHA